jgi:hypothetical protein
MQESSVDQQQEPEDIPVSVRELCNEQGITATDVLIDIQHQLCGIGDSLKIIAQSLASKD